MFNQFQRITGRSCSNFYSFVIPIITKPNNSSATWRRAKTQFKARAVSSYNVVLQFVSLHLHSLSYIRLFHFHLFPAIDLTSNKPIQQYVCMYMTRVFVQRKMLNMDK